MKITDNHLEKIHLRRKLAAKMGFGVVLGIVMGTAVGTVTMNNTGLGLAIGIIISGSGVAFTRWRNRKNQP